MINGIGSALKIILILLQVIVTVVTKVIYVWSQWSSKTGVICWCEIVILTVSQAYFKYNVSRIYYLSTKIMPQTQVVHLWQPEMGQSLGLQIKVTI